MKRYLIPALGSAIIIGGTILIASGTASAHTNSSHADCGGLTAEATNFEATDTNAITVTMDGNVLVSTTFATNYGNTFPVPQDGQTHTWSVAVDSSDDTWDSSVGGTVGPCGELPTTTTTQPEVTTSTTTTTIASTTTLPASTTTVPTSSSTSVEPTTTVPGATTIPTTAPPTTVPDTTVPVITTVPPDTAPPTTAPCVPLAQARPTDRNICGTLVRTL